MMTQLMTTLMNRPENRNQPRLLVRMDEFARYGKLEIITAALSTLRSKGVAFLLAIQSLAQLDYIYGFQARQVIMDCCAYQVIAAAHDLSTQQYFSNRFGSALMWTPSFGESYHPERGEFSVSRQIGGHRENIIYPEKFATLDDFVVLTPFDNFLVAKNPFFRNDYQPPYQRRGLLSRRLSPMLDDRRGYDDLRGTYRR
jgi:type IV secretory pathway TraG/TraD family ATPase VirD4